MTDSRSQSSSTNSSTSTNTTPRFTWFIGVDWGTQQHAVAITDATGAVVREETVAHTSAALAAFRKSVAALIGDAWGEVVVGLEVPRGTLVELFLEYGASVFAINPKQLDRFRDRFSVAGNKNDALDALVLASSLRTDRAQFRRVAAEAPRVIELRELSRAEAVLAEEAVALTNRVRELVHRIAPQWLTLSRNADDPWFWKLLEYALATRDLGRKLRRQKVQSLLRSYRVRRVSTDDVLKVLRTDPVPVAEGTVEAVKAHLALLLPRVRLVIEQRRACTRALDRLLRQLAQDAPDDPGTPPDASGPDAAGDQRPASPDEGGEGATSAARPSDVAILRSATGVGPIVGATFVAEAGPLLALRDYDGLRAVTGAAPVRRQTGKQKQGLVSMRYACNTRLRNACYHWARTSVQLDDGTRRYYAALRSRGRSHARALRSVADRWLRILVAMLKAGTLYDPSRFAEPERAPALGPAA